MTVKNVFLFVFVILATNLFATGYAAQKVFVTVYYESRCPDSRAFVLRQLRPALKQIPEHIVLHLVPFGKARSKMNGYAGYDGFECQHGPAECLGNMVHSCALDLLQFKTDAEKVEYLACEMESYAASKGDLSCVKKAKIVPPQIDDCILSGRGTELQLDAEYLTRQVSPTFVPTVTVDGVFNQKIQDAALRDLIGTICSLLRDPAPNCSRHYNAQAMRQLF